MKRILMVAGGWGAILAPLLVCAQVPEATPVWIGISCPAYTRDAGQYRDGTPTTCAAILSLCGGAKPGVALPPVCGTSAARGAGRGGVAVGANTAAPHPLMAPNAGAAAAPSADSEPAPDSDFQLQQQQARQRADLQARAKDALTEMKGIGDALDSDLKPDGSEPLDLKTADAAEAGGLKAPSDAITDTSVVDLRDTSLEAADRALMRHQWEMSIDARYRNDPEMQQYIRGLVDSYNYSDENSKKSLQHLRSILADQLKVTGLSGAQIQDFFTQFDTSTTGKGQAPPAWDKTSKLAHEIDAAPAGKRAPKDYDEIQVSSIGPAQAIRAKAVYMASGPQAAEDCVLHAIADGAQAPYPKVEASLKPTIENLAIAKIEVRKDPHLAVASTDEGGNGGLNPLEEMLIARQFGKVEGVPAGDFAKAIESTGRPVVTSIAIAKSVHYDDGTDALQYQGSHDVAVTGVYRTPQGKVYYAVMDSNLSNKANYTTYIEKQDFEGQLEFGGGGYVVLADRSRAAASSSGKP